mgnify:CR=1 FL=1
MATLDLVRQLKQQGYNDSDIIRSLQEQGVRPREINDALAQSKIKDAISQNSPTDMTQELNDMQPGMQPSMMAPSPQDEGYSQATQGNQAPQENPTYQNYSPYAGYDQGQQQGYPTNDPNQQQGYPADPNQGYPTNDPNQGYPAYDQTQVAQGTQGYGDQSQGYGNYYASNTDTVSEIASQIIDEKMNKSNKIIKDLIEFKTLIGSKVDRIDERLNRIESIIDQLQAMLMRKATEQEQNIGDIKTEMTEMQKGFGKIINPLVDNIRSSETTKHHTIHHKTKTKSKKKK